jgi:hypothetical protein
LLAKSAVAVAVGVPLYVTDHVRLVPAGMPLTLKAVPTLPGWKDVVWLRSSGPGSNRFAPPTGISTTNAFSLL